MTIVPALLCKTFSEFEKQARRLEGIFDLAQIDVMDGQFVANKSFAEIEKINDLKLKLNFELHLMVERPLDELEKWAEVKNIKRVIFHIEVKDNPNKVIAKIRSKCWGVGIALNPETPLDAIAPYLDKVDEVLFMTVHPGRQGAQFLPEVGKKISKLTNQLITQSTNNPMVAVDGGINAENIALVKSSWGVDIFGVGSAISMAKDIKEAYEQLKQKINYA